VSDVLHTQNLNILLLLFKNFLFGGGPPVDAEPVVDVEFLKFFPFCFSFSSSFDALSVFSAACVTVVPDDAVLASRRTDASVRGRLMN
jgi:hypothetical protein